MDSIVTNLDLFVILKSSEGIRDYQHLFQNVVSRLTHSLSEEDCVTLKEFCRKFTRAVIKRWQSAHRKIDNFRREYGSWLEAEIDWPSCIKENLHENATNIAHEECPGTSVSAEPSTSTCGTMTKRKISSRMPFEELGTKQKKRRSGDLMDRNSTELVYAAVSKLKEDGQNRFASIIEYLTKHPEAVDQFQDMIKKPPHREIFTAEKALGLLLSLKLSKWQYITLRESAIREGLNNLYPSYYRVQQEKKECYPAQRDSITVTDSSAKITLQALLDLTVKRIMKCLPQDLHEKNLILISKWGFDGASSQSRYKQKMESTQNTDDDDSSIFMTSLVPLKMTYEEETVWENPKPCSVSLCRPVQFLFVKESEAVVKEEKRKMDAEISALRPTECGSNTVRHKLMLTMIDAKVCTYISDAKSNASCYVCLAKPSELNNLKAIEKRGTSDSMMDLGISSLHARINMMECLLHIAYRLDVKVWSCKTKAQQDSRDARKKIIQNRFKEEMNLLIDMVKQGHGTTNDGNTARRFFEFPEKTAAITGLDEELIRRFAIILQAITSGEHIRVEKFKEYTYKTAERYVALYNWYYMSSTVHKVLLHGSDIVNQNKIVPIGKLSEEASEARNKDFRRFREHHSRKKSRVNSNEDIFNFLLLSSDPLISSVRPTMDAKKKNLFFEETLTLLELPESDSSDLEVVNVSQIESDSELDSDNDIDD